jgi:hypothetical protein
MILGLCLAALAWTPAMAGPWQREEGRGFAALTWRGGAEAAAYTSLYLDYGLGPRLTLGLDAGRAADGGGTAIVFLQRAGATGRLRHSVQLGLGAREGAPVLRPGLSLGRGFGTGRRSGWVAADAVALIAPDGATDLKLDLTAGLTHPGGRKTMLQLQSGRMRADPPFAKLEASVALPLGRRTSVTLGAFHGLGDNGARGVAIGLWQRF